MYRTITIQTCDKVQIQYPLNPLKRQTTLVGDLIETGYDLNIPLEIPCSGPQLHCFLSLLETKTLEELDRQQSHDALLVADFFGLSLSQLEIARIVNKFGQKAEKFLGVKEIDIVDLIYLVLNQDELKSFETTTLKEDMNKAMDQFISDYPIKKDLKYMDVWNLFLNTCPGLNRVLLKECFDNAKFFDQECDTDPAIMRGTCHFVKNALDKIL